jgi:hypothetical protein
MEQVQRDEMAANGKAIRRYRALESVADPLFRGWDQHGRL